MIACKLVGKLFPTMKTIGGTDTPKKPARPDEKVVEAAPEKIDFSNVKIEPLFTRLPNKKC